MRGVRICTAVVFLAAALLVAGSPSASGSHDPCGGRVGPAELGVEAFVIDLAGMFYLDVRHVAADQSHLYSIWLYQETNGEPGLQRGDPTSAVNEIWCLNPTGCLAPEDPCAQARDPDSMIF